MRPGQQQQNNNNKRMRGRGRKGPNTLSRSFESNGPDVKIRGTAQHIAEKYTTLARDASASGDRVMAENYLQHAEHYGRIVAAAQGSFQLTQNERDFGDEDENEEAAAGEFAQGYGGERGQPNGYGDRGQQQAYQGDRGQAGGYGGGERGQANGHGGERNGQNFRQNRDGNPGRDQNGNRDGNAGREQNASRDQNGNRGDQGNRDRRDARDNQADGRGERGGYNNRGRPDAPNGTGPQPFSREGQGEQPGVAPEEAAFRADRSDGQRRGEGHRRDRPDRPRLNEQGGERRFEERSSSLDQAESGPVAASPQPEPAASPPDAGTLEQGRTAPLASATDVQGEPRRRGRPRRERSETADVPSSAADSPATLGADAPVLRSEPASAPEAARAAGPESGDAPVKRRPGRPRKKKPEDEGDVGDQLPAFLLASNG